MKHDFTFYAWAASMLSLIGLVLNIRQNALCWPVWLLTTGTWLVLSALKHDWPMAAMQAGIEVGNLMGLVSWQRKARSQVAVREEGI